MQMISKNNKKNYKNLWQPMEKYYRHLKNTMKTDESIQKQIETDSTNFQHIETIENTIEKR